jgi:hypothetical protein
MAQISPLLEAYYTLDAHLSRTTPFTYQELLSYMDAGIPESQVKAIERHRIMPTASSKKTRQPVENLESRYQTVVQWI